MRGVGLGKLTIRLCGSASNAAGGEVDVLADGQVRRHAGGLPGPAEARAGALGDAQGVDVVALEQHVALIARQIAGHSVDEGRFARAIGTDEADDLAFRHAQGGVVQGHHVAVANGDAAGLQGVGRAGIGSGGRQRGFIAAMQADKGAGEVINVGSGFEISIGDAVRTIAEATYQPASRISTHIAAWMAGSA